MAKINPSSPIADIHGALQRGDKVVYRVRDGVQQAYIVKHPYEGKPAAQRTPKPPTTLYGFILSELSKETKNQ